VYTSKDRSFRYDKCVIATGSTASLPPYTSMNRVAKTRGVFLYRNISDLDSIIAYAERDDVKHAVVVGGGLLGLEAAKALHDLETWVSQISALVNQESPFIQNISCEHCESPGLPAFTATRW